MNCPRCHRPPNAAIVVRGHRYMCCEPDRVAWDTGPLYGVAELSPDDAALIFDSDDPMAVAAREAAAAELAKFTLTPSSKEG